MTDSGKNAPRFLVVEDEQVIGDIFRRVLTGEGFGVDIAANGEIARRMVKTSRYDFCILDIKMPRLNGHDFYRWLREEQPALAEHVLFTTGDVMSIKTWETLKHNGMPFLLKPFTPDDLRCLVKRVTMDYRCPV